MQQDQASSKLNSQRKFLISFVIFATISSIIACLAFFHIFVDKAFVEVEIAVTESTDVKIYWAEKGELYAEDNMFKVVAEPGTERYLFSIQGLGSLERLRVDTHEYLGQAVLKRLSIQQEGYETIVIDSADSFKRLLPLSQVAESRVGSNGLQVISSGVDPSFELFLGSHTADFDRGWLVIRLAAICCVIFFLCWYAKDLTVDLRFVPIMLFGVWLLIIVMAVISGENSHPDEYVHLAAADYYIDNWLPPEIDDPGIGDTFSIYGYSRLNNGEIYYLIAGKFGLLLDALHIPDYLALRFFNVLLFGGIFFLAVRSVSARMVALPLLVSPQIWYVFSYCTSDAFALFVVFLAGCQIIDPQSLIHRYFTGGGRWTKITGVVLLGTLAGFLFFLKSNYYPFIALLGLCLLIKIFLPQEYSWDKKDAIIRLAAVCLLAATVFGVRTGVDYMVNGPDRQVKIERLREEKAEYYYKPSTPLEKKHMYLSRKERGSTWQALIYLDRWAEISFRSAVGVFGYFTISGPSVYYDVMRWSGLWLLSFFFVSVLLRGGPVGAGVALSALGLSLALIGASFHHSWTVDFQPQGRYLFPILPMLGIAYGWNYRVVHRPTLFFSVSVMFFGALYFFIFQGLLRIPKLPL